jgi:hypothetical protein
MFRESRRTNLTRFSNIIHYFTSYNQNILRSLCLILLRNLLLKICILFKYLTSFKITPHYHGAFYGSKELRFVGFKTSKDVYNQYHKNSKRQSTRKGPNQLWI